MTTIQKIVVGLVICLAAGAVVMYQTRWRYRFEGRLCVPLYSQAHNAADTAMVDAKLPPLDRGETDFGVVPTCGELRKMGQVR